MTIKRTMAMMSHLSDVQELIQYQGTQEEVRMRVNFVKMLIHEEREELTNDELNELWKECNKKYGRTTLNE